MKGKVDSTIPQRQYENIKVCYYFENEKEKKEAINAVIDDCIEYRDAVGKKIAQKIPEIPVKSPLKGEPGVQIIGGVKWKNFVSYWAYKNDKTGQWINSDTPPLQ